MRLQGLVEFSTISNGSTSCFLLSKQALHLVIQDSCRGKEEGKIGDRGTETRRFRSDYLFIYLVLI